MTEIVAVAQAGMLADVERLRAVSQNLANISTLGYKREIVVTRPFVDVMDALNGSGGVSSADVTPMLSSETDHSAGSLKFTANPLDLSLDANDYFVIRTETGEALTRQGNFRLDNAGRLVTASGATVLGSDGEIRLTTPNPRVNQDGSIWEGPTQVANLRIAHVSDPSQLQRLGNGLYLATSSLQTNDESNTNVRQGYVETANAVAMDEMIHMIEAVRHFEASQRLLRGYDSMLDRAINVLGEV
jgi:flagellar basal-body rod protein FlgF